MLFVVASELPAGANSPFTPVFSTNAPGDIVYVSNTNATCIAGSPYCAAAQAGAAINNNSFGANMQSIDVDSDPATFNSNFANYSLPAGGQVLWAGLYWTSYYTGPNADKDDVLFQTPATGGYVPISASFYDDWTNNDDFYTGFADVTNLVQAGGTGTYGVGNIAVTNNTINSMAGWTIVVVHEDPSENWRNLTVNHGFTGITGSIPRVDITVSGFTAPPVGPVNAEIGMIAFEGDLRGGGDYAEVNGTRLGDALNPTNNFFNSSLTDGGSYNGGNSPTYPANTLGYDADIVSTSGIVQPNDTLAAIRIGTAGEWFFPSVVTTAIDIYVPNLSTNLTKTSNDLNGENIHPGDILEYSISLDNTGQDPSVQTVVTDTIPAGTTYVPGSLQVVSDNSPAGPRTDAQDGDTAWFDGSAVHFNIGDGATGAVGGQVDPVTQGGMTHEVRFQVQVDANATGATVTNEVDVNYVAKFVNEAYSSSTSVSDVVEPLVDLAVVKSDTPDPVVAGEVVAYTIDVSNAGPSIAQNVVVTDTLPAGMSFAAAGSDPSCSASGLTVTCTISSLGIASTSLIINAVVDEDVAVASLTNQVNVSSDTHEHEMADNDASEPTAVVRNADLSVDKQAAAEVDAGNQLTYTLTVTNDGPSSANNVVLADALPAGVTLASASASGGGSCSGAVVCTWAKISSGDAETVTIVVDVPAGTASGTALENKTKVGSDDPDDDESNNTDSTTTTVEVAADMSIDKVLKDGPLVAGAQAIYDLVVTNGGPSNAVNVEVEDAVVAGLTYSAAASSPACTLTAGTVTCAGGTMAPGTSTTFTLVFDVDSSLVDGSSVANTATVSSDTADPTPANNSDTTTDVVGRQADLFVVKDDNTTTTPAGGQITYTLSYGNSGPSDATGVVIVDTLPGGATFSSSADCTATAPNTVSCPIGTLAAGDTGTVSFVVDVDPSLVDTASLVNTATISGNEVDPVAGNNTSTVGTDVDRIVDLSVQKSDVADPVRAGENVTYTLRLTNNGPSTETNATLVDQLPTGLTFVSVSDSTACANAANTVTCNVGTMAPSDVYTVTLTAAVDPSLADGTILSNTVVADGDVADPVDDTEETTVSTEADLVLVKTAPTTVTAGTQLTFTLSATNDGPSTATGVVINDTLPAGLSYDSYSVTAGSATCSEASGVVTCTVGTLGPSATTEVEITVDVDPSLAGGTTLSNGATATSNTNDPNPDNNTDIVETDVETSADLATVKTTITDPVVAGQSARFQIEVTNNGPSTATGVTVSDVLPSGFVFDAASSSTGCVAGVTCSGPTLLPTQSATFTIVADVESDVVAATYTNNASATADQNDPVSDNDADESTIDVEEQADLQIVKNADTAVFVPGTTATWTLTVTNNGASDAAAVTVTDTLPTGLTFNAGGSDSRCLGGVTCTLGAIAAGVTETIVLAADVDADVVGNVENTATVSSPTPDPTVGNNSSTESTPTRPQADLSLIKTGPSEVVAGTQITYTLIVSNAGPSTATGVVINDVLPSGMTVNAAGTDANCTAAIVCSLPDLGPGDSETVTVVVDVDSTVADGTTLTNDASVDSDADDSDPSNNNDAVDTEVSSEADVQVTKTAPSPVAAGTSLTYSITIANSGPSTATNVTVADTLPAGITATSVTATGGALCTNGVTSVGCSIAALAPGDTATVQITADVDAALAEGTLTANRVDVQADQDDPDPDNNSDEAEVEITAVADLSVTKSGSPDTAIAGEEKTYTVIVTNDGPSDAQVVQVTDNVSSPLTITSVSSPTMTCSVIGQAVTCSQPTLANGETASITIVTTVSSELPADSTIVNTATATSQTTDPDPDNNADDDVSGVEAQSDLQLVKTSSKSPAVAGEWHPFTLTVTNNGPSLATNVVVSDTLPADTTFNSALSDANCSQTGGTVTCSLSDISAQATTSVVVVVDLPADFVDDSNLANSASASADQPDPDPDNNEDDTSVPVENQADLAIVKDGDGGAVPGEPYTWTLSIVNDGPSDAENVVVTDTLPPGTSLASGTDQRCTLSGAVLTCPIGTLAAEAADSLAIVVDVASSVGDAVDLTNVATITSTTDDPDPDDNSSRDTATATRSSELDISKSDVSDPVVAGEQVSWEIVVTNLGPSDAANVVITDQLPPEVSFVSADNPSCSITAGQVTCNFANLDNGDQITVTVVGLVDSSVADGTVLENSATTLSDSSDPVSDTETTTISRASDLSIQKVSDALVVAGTQHLYSLTVSNDGPSDADNVVVSDILPAGFVFVSSTPTACTEDGQVAACPVGTIAAGETSTFEILVDVSDAAAAVSRNNATVTSDSPDPDPANNTDDDETEVVSEADLDIVKELVGDLVPGQPATWQLTVTNNGPSQAVDVAVTDQLDPSLSFVADGSSGGCSAAGPVVTCDHPLLANGATATFTIVTDVDPSLAGSLTNTAQVTSSTTDPDPANNTSAIDVSAEPSSDLSLVKAASTDMPVAGEAVTYTVTVTNEGPSDAQGVQVVDVVPATLAIGSAASATMTCGTVGQTVTCDQPTIPAGETATITIVTTVDSTVPAGSAIANSATATSDTPDPDPDNNTDETSSTSNALADVALVKVSSKSPAVAGEWHPFTLTATNNGPSLATNVVVSDTLPAGTTFNSALSDAGCSETGGTVTCLLSNLGDQVSASVVVVVDIPADFADGGDLTNSASVAADQLDPDPDNNDDDVTVPVDNAADLSIVKDGDGAAVPGESYTWTLNIVNDGPSDAVDVVVADTVPAGTSVAAGTDSRCSFVGPVLSCAIGPLAAGASDVVTVVVDVASSVGDAVGLTNTASITSSTDDPDPDDNASDDTATAARSSQLDISKSDVSDPVIAGEEVTWEILVANLGPSDAANVVISDELPPDVSFVSVDNPDCGASGNTVACNIATLAEGAQIAVTVVGLVSSSVADGTVLENTATTSSDSSDPVSDTETTTVSRASDLRIEKTSDGEAVAGTQHTYTVSVTNDGPSDADNIVVSDILPIGFTFVSSAPTACAEAAQVVTCTIGTMTAGEAVTFEMLVDVADTAADLSRNNVTVSSDSPDPDPSNDVDDDETSVIAEADLEISKELVGDLVPGEAATWQVTVTNNGPSEAVDVAVTDELDPAFSFVDIDSTATCSEADQLVTCQHLLLVSGDSVTFVVVADVDPGVTATLTNTVEVSSSVTDPDTANNTATIEMDAKPSSDLSLTKTASTDVPVAGAPLSFDLVIHNAGPSTATAIELADPIPAGVAFDAGTTDPGCMLDPAAEVIVCGLAALAPGEASTFTIGFIVDEDLPEGGSVRNVASVQSETPDPVSHNEAEATVPPERQVALTLTKELADSALTPGTTATWTFTVTNDGPSSANNVLISDPLVDGLSFVDAESHPDCTEGDLVTVDCSIDRIGPGETVTVHMVTAVAPDLAIGDLTNTATVASDEGGGDEAAATVPVQPNDAVVTVDKSGPRESVELGDQVRWAIAVTNEGPSDVTVPIQVTDPLPDGLDFKAVTATPGVVCDHTGAVVSCTVESLDADTTVDINITTTATAIGELTNAVTVDAHGLTDREPLAAQGTVLVAAPDRPGVLALTGWSAKRLLATAGLLVVVGTAMALAGTRRLTDSGVSS